ncbi:MULTISPECIES: lysozyme inhibitor LprI family protein [Alphaproteobacteria]|uniref:Lysozyme inhibitor LprI-like N-terminal domain-containing protein n=2 Tax=Alphaproteobacteria TaxID=28211 RepID=A0A512HJI4_9HYPH|nr:MULTISPECIES: lysozyme inhibitor LprI family protein [Alphaproteobacteria]GEO85595.1 hypothetical protein RNA01_25270 [Ciceribacter naphthalenivorans]GLR22050.1 hypothetical protein GCM10007920_18370 [Ciceribacter naphthalenivorans]GLT04906.1 hypothetical protein GCM10007926_18370 [Sphingomonas psychrolutea]
MRGLGNLLKSMTPLARSSSALAALALCLVVAPASAEDEPIIKCEDAVTQTEMTVCAVQEHEAADKKLNEQWGKTKKAVAEWDAGLDAEQRGAVDALMKAQRAWIQYRDGHCDVQGFSVRGGSLEPAIIELCLADLTRKRTAELEDLINGFGN